VQLKIFLPHKTFACIEGVTQVVFMTPAGSFGLLPHRLDCATVLSPGLLTYSTVTTGQVYLAVNAGVLVKTGADVLVCVRHAIAGADLGGLRQAIEREFLTLSEQEKSNRTTLAQLESGLIRGLIELRHA
jgi:F-type H+-transporting ATPase subunit epsilon